MRQEKFSLCAAVFGDKANYNARKKYRKSEQVRGNLDYEDEDDDEEDSLSLTLYRPILPVYRGRAGRYIPFVSAYYL